MTSKGDKKRWQKKYRASHAEQIRAYNARYRLEHDEERRHYNAKYRAEHADQRRTYSKVYDAKRSAERRAYNAQHTQQQSEYNKRYYATNGERLRDRSKAYREAHPEECRRNVEKWCAANPQRARENANAGKSRRRARERSVQSTLTATQFKVICVAQGGKCACCGKRRKLTIDHVVAISKGGSNTADNVQALCLPCNQTKHTKDTDYRKALPLPLWEDDRGQTA